MDWEIKNWRQEINSLLAYGSHGHEVYLEAFRAQTIWVVYKICLKLDFDIDFAFDFDFDFDSGF